MEKQKKGGKYLLIGIAAAVVVLLALLALVLTQCSGGSGATPTTGESTTGEEGVPTYTLYWNVDRAEFDGKSEAGLSSRKPKSDGSFHIRFILDGEEVTLKTTDRKVVNTIDTMDLMGLEFDKDGYITAAIDVEELPLQMVGWKYYVQSVGGKVIKVNSSRTFVGLEILLECTANTGIYDMTGTEGPIGSRVTPAIYDRIIAIANLAGELTHVFLYDRSDFMLSHDAHCQHCDQTVSWKEWTKEDALPTESGHYQLQNDIQLTGQQSMTQQDQKICLDLNGKRVDGAKNQRVFSLHNAGSELALMDTSEEKTGALVGHSDASPQGGVVWVRYGVFYMYGGTLDGSDMTSRLNGCVVQVPKSSFFYLYDGTVIGGTAAPQYNEETGKYTHGLGGAIQLSGTMRMYGGTIRDGKAPAIYYYNNGKYAIARGMGGNIFMASGSVLEIKKGEILNGYAGNVGGNIMMDGTAELIIQDGLISGGWTNSQIDGKNGANIYCPSKGTIEMNGGTVTGGRNLGGSGGNLYLAGKMNMNGGTISGGSAKFSGGNVMLSGSGVLNIRGGAIMGGVANGEKVGNGGGNIHVSGDKAVLNLYAGILSGGKAKGLVNEDGTTAGGDGGNINLSKGALHLYGGTITGGSATGNGGGIYAAWNSKAVNLGGSAMVYGNEKTDICRSSNTDEGKSRILLNGWKGNGKNPALVIGRLDGTAGALVAEAAANTVLKETDVAFFASAKKVLPLELDGKGRLCYAQVASLGAGTHSHCLCAGNYVNHKCADTAFVEVTAEEFLDCFVRGSAANKLLGSLNLCLTEDVTISREFQMTGYELNLCLHGHTITVEDKGRITANTDTGLLRLTDCKDTGKILAAEGCRSSILYTYNGAIEIYGGTVNASACAAGSGSAVFMGIEEDSLSVYGGHIIGGQNAKYGSAIVCNVKGNVSIHGGHITGGRATKDGGAIYMSNGTLTITGGTVEKGEAAVSGGNIYMSKGVLDISGGTITGGKSGEYGGGVYFGYNATSFRLSGDAKLYGNAGSDIYLGSKSSNLLTLHNWVGNGTDGALKIGKLNGKTGTVLAKAAEGRLEEGVSSLFASANEGFGMIGHSGKVVLYPVSAAADHSHCVCGGKLESHECKENGYTTVTAEQFKALWLVNGKNFDLGADQKICLGEDVTLSAEYRLMGHQLDLCLHGHTVTMEENGRITANGTTGVLNLADCKDTGKVVAAEGSRGGLLYTYKGQLNVYSGTVDGSACKAGSGALVAGQDGDAISIYGGTLKGSKKAANGGVIYTNHEATVSICGGTVTGGAATENGGNIYMGKGTLAISGGQITDGSAMGNGGGIYLGYNATALTLSGNTVISGNQGADVFLGSKASNVITLDGWAGNGEKAPLVVGKLNGVTGTVLVKSVSALEEDAVALFSSADKNFSIMLHNGKLILYSADALAAHMHCLCNGQVADHGCFETAFAEVSAQEFLAHWIPNGKNYDLGKDISLCLTEDVTLSSEYRLMGHTLNLCLHGHTITLQDNGRITANGTTGVLNLADCKDTGKVVAAEGCRGGLLYTYKGQLNVYSGTVDASACAEGGVGAVCVGFANDSFTLYGGTLKGSEKAEEGGAVQVAQVGTVTIHGGTIHGGNVTGNGGAIYVEDGTLSITGGTITGGRAAGNGGNICFNRGELNVTGGVITAGQAGGNGGGLYLGYNATGFQLSGDARFYGNAGSDICLGSKSTNLITLGDWTGNGDQGALKLAKVNGTTGSVLVKPAQEGLLAAGTEKYFTSADETKCVLAFNNKLVLYPVSAAADHSHCVCGGKLESHECKENGYTTVTAEQFKALWLVNGKNFDLGADQKICLGEDVTLSAEYRLMGHQLDLCLHGHTVTMEENGRITANGTTGVLNLADCKDTGKVVAAEGSRGGLLYTYKGQLNVYSGTVDGSACKAGSGTVVAGNDGDAVFVYGGTLKGSKKAANGGVIYTNHEATVSIYGGTVTGGAATENGGNIYMGKGTLAISGGQITDGSAMGNGGGIYLGYNATALTLSGNAVISGNQGADVFLGSKASNVITLDGWTGNGEKAALVVGKLDGKLGSVVVTAAAEEDLQKFAAAGDFDLKYEDGSLKLESTYVHDHCICNGALDGHGCKQLRFVPVAVAEDLTKWFDDSKTLTASMNFMLQADISLDAEYKLGGHNLNLCLNGHTITLDGGRLTANKGGNLNITDCGTTGTIKAVKADGKQFVFVQQGAVSLYGGTIDGSLVDTTGNGAAIYVNLEDAAFRMYGGTVLGGKVGYGGAIYVKNGSAEILGGAISGGQALSSGGNIFVSEGQLTVSGNATVEKGQSYGDGSGEGGGNIQLETGTAKVIISGGTITGGKAAANGGNININKGQLEISGGTVTLGEAAGNGGGIYLGWTNTNVLKLSGSALIHGNTDTDICLGANTKNYITLGDWTGNGQNGTLKLKKVDGKVGSLMAVPAGEHTFDAEDAAKFACGHEGLKLSLRETGLVMIDDHSHCICDGLVGHTCQSLDYKKVDQAGFEALFDANGNLKASSSIFLMEDITLSAEYKLNGNHLDLCLGGKTISMTGGKLTANKSGTLNITDCGTTGTIASTVAANKQFVFVQQGTLNLYGGTIDASLVDTTGNGAAIYVNLEDAAFHMYGGQILGGKVAQGGAVYVNAGSFHLHSGTVEGGKATSKGGNIYCESGNVTVSGGNVTDGECTGTGGGNIYMTNGALTVSGGVISGGKATGTDTDKGMGGNIHGIKGTMVISGGEITGGVASGKTANAADIPMMSGGIYVGYNYTSITLSSDAKVYGNTGADFWLSSNKKFALTLGDWAGNGEKGVLKLGKSAGSRGDNMAIPAADILLDETVLAKFTCVHEAMKFALKEGNVVMVDDHGHCICDGLQGHDCQTVAYTAVNAQQFLALFGEDNYLTGSHNVFLTEGITLSSEYRTGDKILNLCLNGNTITLDGGKLVTNQGGTLNITDCGTTGTIRSAAAATKQFVYVQQGTLNFYGGKIDASLVDTTGNGAAIYVNLEDASFHMYGGQILGGKVAQGGAVYVNAGSFHLHSGTVEGGKATSKGGNIYCESGNVTVSGGNVTDGECAGTGGGNIYMTNGALTVSGGVISGGKATGTDTDKGMGGNIHGIRGTMVISGGEITGGVASGKTANAADIPMMSGGIYVGYNYTSITLSGDAKVYGNTGADFWLSSNKKFALTLGDWAGNGEKGALKLGKSAGSRGDILVKPVNGITLSEATLEKLSCVHSGMKFVLREGDVVLEQIHIHCACGGSYDHSHSAVEYESVTAAQFLALFSEGNLKHNASVCLVEDVTLESEYKLGGNTLDLCLNGRTVSVAEGGKLTTNGSGTLNITDCGTTGTVASTVAANKQFVFVQQGTLNLYGGTIDASQVDTTGNGAAIYVNLEDAAFHMYGGQILGGKVAQGGAVYVNAGSFHLHSGTVEGGTASEKGGNLYIAGGSATLSGGTLSGGEAKGAGGGNIFVDTGAVTLSGATVTGGKATGTAKAKGLGGNIHNLKGTVNLTGGVITGGVASGKPTDEAASGRSGGIYQPFNSKALNLGGNAQVYGNVGADIFLGGNKTNLITLDGWAGNGTNGPLKVEKLSTTELTLVKAKEGAVTYDQKGLFSYATDDCSIALFDGELRMTREHVHCICGGTLAGTAGHTCVDVVFTAITGTDAFLSLFDAPDSNGNRLMKKANTIYLDLEADETITVTEKLVTNGHTLDLCLNGCQLTMKGGRLTTNQGGTSHVTDCGTTGTIASTAVQGVYVQKGTMNFYQGTIDASAVSSTSGNGGAVYVNAADATFHMYDGVIRGATKAKYGGAVYVNAGSFLLEKGNIYGGAVSRGGAIYCADVGIVDIRGGKIQGGTAEYGGCIGINKGSLLVSGGEITGGSATISGAGVNLFYAMAGQMEISGNAKIYGNNGADVHCGQNGAAKQYFNVDSNWQGNGGAALVLSTGNAAAGNTVVKGSLTQADLANFAYLNGDFKLAVNGGNVVLAAK